MITQSTIQQILSRIDIIEIVGSFVKLKKRGTSYLGLCPFHNEKTPSFTVSPAKEIYKCFGCGKSGNSISFLMEHEKYSYVETLRWLAQKYNVAVEETEVSPEVKAQQQVADSLYIINSFAGKFFEDKLFNTEEGVDIALSYLKHRGFREDIIKKFQLGYSPLDRTAFSTAAVAAQYNPELLQKSGLAVLRNEELADNYRGRIIFPIHNNSGKIIGFGARIIKNNDKAPKYINTPENELYVKSRILYGSYFARQAIDKNDECLLVEGYTDVVSLHQAGIENVVASGGTSLTIDQLRLVKKYTNNLTIIYDGDSAGIKAALRGLDLAMEEGLNVKLVLIPDNEDPDSYVNKVGTTAFREFVAANKKDFILFRLDVALKDMGEDPNKKAIIVNQIAETIAKINRAEDFTKQQDYIRQCSQLLKIDEAGLNTLVNKFIHDRISKQESKARPVEEATVIDNDDRSDWSSEAFSVLFQDRLQELAFIRVLLEYGLKEWENNKTVADCIIDEEIGDDLFNEKKVPLLYNEYKKLYLAGKEPTIKDFAYYENQEIALFAIEATNHPFDGALSKKWREETGNVDKRIFNLSYEDFIGEIIKGGQVNPDIYVHQFDVKYKDEVDDVILYLKLQKIKKMMLLNQEDLLKPHTYEELLTFIKAHNHLKEAQMELGKRKGMIIYPF